MFQRNIFKLKRNRKVKTNSVTNKVKFSQFRGMLGGGFMIGKMEGETISDRFAKKSPF